MTMFMMNTSRNYSFFSQKLCARRILCFLKWHYLEGAAHELERETTVFFDVSHLQYLARNGRWDELISYCTLFMPSVPELRSHESCAFFRCAQIWRELGKIAAGGKMAEDFGRVYPLLDKSAAKDNPVTAAVNAFLHQLGCSFLREAAEKLKDMALKCPEIKGKLYLPNYAPKHCQINLSGVRPVQRPFKKKVNKQKAFDIACFFKKKQQDMEKRPSAPESETPAVAGTSGVNGRHESEAEDNASKLKKCKMTANLDTDTNARTWLMAWKGSSTFI